MSKIEVDKIDPQSGTDLELGSSGDTITIPTGATLDASNATTTLPANVVTTDGSQTLTNKSIAATQLTGTITPSDNTVSLAKLTATGTKDATTFLRGDNTFATPTDNGKVLQVVTGTFTTQTDSSSASYVATGLTASITPSSTANKILILYSLPFRNGNTGTGLIAHSIFKNGSNLLGTYGAGIFRGDNSALMANATSNYLDSPNTTSSTTYAIYVNPESLTVQWCGASATASITLLEIAG
jgi:hypothetical protein